MDRLRRPGPRTLSRVDLRRVLFSGALARAVGPAAADRYAGAYGRRMRWRRSADFALVRPPYRRSHPRNLGCAPLDLCRGTTGRNPRVQRPNRSAAGAASTSLAATAAERRLGAVAA